MSRSIPAGGQMTPFDRASLSLNGSELPPPTVGGSPLTSGGQVAALSGGGVESTLMIRVASRRHAILRAKLRHRYFGRECIPPSLGGTSLGEPSVEPRSEWPRVAGLFLTCNVGRHRTWRGIAAPMAPLLFHWCNLH